MMNMIQQMMQQQGIQGFQPHQTPADELMIHQEPIAASVKALIKLLEYEKRHLSIDVFNAMIDSLKQNIITSLDRIKMPVIPPSSEIVSINGEPATIQSQG